MFRPTFYLIFFCLLLLPTKMYGFKHISTQEGLSNKRTFSVLKDKDGFIWFATRDGVDRYDGKNIKQYKLLDKTQTINFAGRINKLVADESLNLWVFSPYGQIFEYVTEQDRYNFRIDISEEIEGPDFYMYGMAFMDKEHFFVYGSFGLYLYNIPQSKLTRVECVQNRYVSGVTNMANNQYALSTRTGVCIAHLTLLPDGELKEELHETPLKERTKSIYYEKSDNSLIIGTYSGHIYRYDCVEGTMSHPLHRLNVTIRDIDCYDQTIYIATDGKGIVRLNRDNLGLLSDESYFGLTEQDSRLNFIYDIFIDENRLWIATYNDGIFLYDRNLADFRFTQVYHRSDNLAGAANTINSILEDSRGDLWIASNYGVARYDKKQNEWRYILNNNQGHSVLSLCEDNRGYIWAGGGSHESAICIDPHTLKTTVRLTFPNDFTNVSSGRIYCVYSAQAGYLWFGGMDCNLTRYNPETGKEKHYPVMFVNYITEHNRTLYIGTTHGLYTYDRINDRFIPHRSMLYASSPVRKFINCIHIDEQETLWLGTEGGLIRCVEDSIQVYDNGNGLESDYIQAILPDSRKRLWVSTSNGLACIDPQSGSTTKYSTEEGLNNDIFKNRSAIRNQKGEFMFGTIKGILQFTPEHIDRPHVHNRIVLTHFDIFGSPVYPGHKDSPLTDVIDKVHSIHLKHTQKTFTLGFVNINYTNPYNTHFEWKLEGYDKDWLTHSTTYTPVYYNQLNSPAMGLKPTSLANPNLKWETTVTNNIGVDVGLFNNRLSLSMEAYLNKTKDLLLDAKVSPTSGYTTQMLNIGKTQNKGFEFTLSGVIINKKDFTWDANLNMSFNKNKILSLNRDANWKQDYYVETSKWGYMSGDYLVQVGKPLGLVYGYVNDGFYTADDFKDAAFETGIFSPANLKDDVPYAASQAKEISLLGQTKVKRFSDNVDESGHPMASADYDKRVIGDTNPDFFGGFGTSITYKNFDLSIFLNFVVGNDIYNATKVRGETQMYRNQNVLQRKGQRYTIADPTTGAIVLDRDRLNEINKYANLPAIPTIAQTLTDDAVEDGSFLRINNISLGYTLPYNLVKKAGIKTLRVYVTGYNLHTFTNYTGYDPEVDSRMSTPVTPGLDYAAYPRSRQYVMGANITF